jgi:preprotein translocase subunit SecG
VERRWDYLGKLCIAMMMMMMMINSALCIKILLQSSYLNDVGATVMDIC